MSAPEEPFGSANETIEALRKEIAELRDWKRKYTEAAELWDALELRQGQQVKDAMMIGKIVDFEKGITSISLSNTDGMDWVDQLGLLEAARLASTQSPLEPDDDD